ncbi:YlmH/Sll1252 family protein [Proteiniborus sp.]|uniref:YlmH family RNA-binding protein n=1 Tax=Proteiniborus sp. TaxID=2079015 RepID=UPI00331E8E4E
MTIDKTALIQHIKDREQILVLRRAIDKLERVLENYSIEYTDFLDPYQRKLCHSFLNRFKEVSFFEEGGLEDSERKSIVMYPIYIDRNDIEIPIKALRIDGSFKFKELSHRDYLGALMNLGIKREKIGDILIHKNYGTIITFEEIVNYIKYNLKMINKESVFVTEMDISELVEVEEEYTEKSLTLSSYRLDVFVSTICNISREKSSSLIKNGYVKVNWQTIGIPSKEIHVDDMISIRGFGRIKVTQNLGKTKKDRNKVVVRLI